MTAASLDPIFVNHLAFLAAHRGVVSMDAAGVVVRSAMPGFSSFTPWNLRTGPPANAEAVRLAPGGGDGWDERLSALGWKRAEALVYMELADDRSLAAAPTADVQIVEAVSEDDAVAFAEAQAAGFEVSENDEARWREHLRTAAINNVPRDDQTFLMALADARPAAVSLTVRAGGVAGVYAVATRPEHRGEGLSTALLKQSTDDARAAGLERIVLQVMRGAYAERFYRKIGFVERYVSQVWRRT